VSSYRIALERALATGRERGYKFDAIAVSSWNHPGTGLAWSFGFYDARSEQYVGESVTVSHNGSLIADAQ
jgi:hypothetical protein